MNKFVIYGSGQHSYVVVEIAKQLGHKVSFLLDQKSGRSVYGIPVFKFEQHNFINCSDTKFLVAIGDNNIRTKVYKKLLTFKLEPMNLIHPKSIVSESSHINDGTVVMGGVTINSETLISQNCIINTNSSIDHHCIIGDNVHICPGVHLAGNVHVGDNTMLGIGSCVIPGIHIGSHCVIGAGTVVINHIPDFSLVVGVPGKIVRKLNH